MASHGLVLPEIFPEGMLITDIKQIVTSTEDSGENVIQVELFNGKKFKFKVRNGSKGSSGEKGEKGDKGDKGEKGDAGGFAEPTAEVDNASGIPSVTVSASGIDSKKKFHFVFKNLKGDKGEKGDMGIQGARGDKGEKGDRGDKGEAGKWDGKVPVNPNPKPTAEGYIWLEG